MAGGYGERRRQRQLQNQGGYCNRELEGRRQGQPPALRGVRSVEASGPPSVVVVKATALPFSSSIRQTKKTKAWESYTLSGIANQVAGQNGLKCMYESSINPSYGRVEQNKQSDIKLLERLCKDVGKERWIKLLRFALCLLGALAFLLYIVPIKAY